MKQKILFFILCTITITGYSQFVIGPQKTIGGNNDDELGGAWFTTDGGVIAAGRSYSDISGDKTDYNRGIDDYWVVKLNKAGKIQWQRTLGGSDVDECLAVQQTSDGGYILAGNSQSNISGEKTENSKGLFDCWVIKLDALGNIVWQKTLGGDQYEFCNSIQQTKDGGYIVGCMSNSNASSDKSEDSKGGYDFWLIKLDASGNKQWDKTLGGSGDEFTNDVIQTADGGYIAVGLSNSTISGDKSENNRGANDYWAIKLDRFGNKQWDKTIGGNADDYVNSVAQTPDGGYALFGASASNKSGDKTENIHGGFDYWLVKLNKQGVLVFQKTIGGLSDDYGQTIENTADGGLILGGQSISPISSDKDENCWGGFDYWVVKMNANGTIAWNKDVGSDGDDNLRSIQEISKNKYLLGGFSWGNIYGDKTDMSRGSNDFWIITLDYSNGFVEDANTANASVAPIKVDNTFSVFPNPAKNIVNVKTTSKGNFTLIDQSGKTLLNKTIDGSGTIDVSAFATGYYFIRNNATGLSKRVLVVK